MTTTRTLWNWFRAGSISADVYHKALNYGKANKCDANQLLFTLSEIQDGFLDYDHPICDFRFYENSQLIPFI